MSIRLLAGAAALSLIAAALAPTMAGAASPAVAAAIADPARPQKDRDLDADRKPAEILEAMGLKPGQKVADVFPGPYWERLFGDLVGPNGKIYMVFPTELLATHKNIQAPPDGAAPFPDHPNVISRVMPVNQFSLPEQVDVVWIRQNYHDLYDPFMGPADVPAFNKAVFKALKRGGLYVIVDHAAPKGSGLAATNTTHRIDEERVKADMAAAGFVFAGESNALRNSADTRDKMVFDPSLRGHTDQFIHLFKKP